MASVPPTVVRPAQIEHAPFVMNGRIAVRHNGERTSANVRWTHTIKDDEILLFAPLGQTVARIYQNADGVVLDASGKHYTAHNTEALTQQVLGWPLPLNGLRYWVLALPAPDSEFALERNEHGQISQLQQTGWTIQYARYASTDKESFPLRMTLQRAELHIQLLVDEWEVAERL